MYKNFTTRTALKSKFMNKIAIQYKYTKKNIE